MNICISFYYTLEMHFFMTVPICPHNSYWLKDYKLLLIFQRIAVAAGQYLIRGYPQQLCDPIAHMFKTNTLPKMELPVPLNIDYTAFQK